MPLKSLLNHVKNTMGIAHKKDIQTIGHYLTTAKQNSFHPNGDDTAVIPSADGYDLFSGEGFLESFVQQDPWFAGWCGIMVNVSDIAAMGGRPTAVINSYWGRDDITTENIFAGMSAASRAFEIPIVGGHTNLQAEKPQLAVSILGKAKKLLSSFAAKPNQALIAAIDCRGEYREPFLNWNAATSSPAERLRGDIALLPYIAENDLASAGKDISQAGLLGTCLMMLECSNVGAHIQLENIPKPDHVDWQSWLCSFPSYGYLLTTNTAKVDDLLAQFHKRDIRAAKIGHITEEPKLTVADSQASEIFWDLSTQALTGMAESSRISSIPQSKNIHNYLNKRDQYRYA